MKWIDFREHKPTKSGEYLCKVVGGFDYTHFEFYLWSNDLSDLGFRNKKGMGGFCYYDEEDGEWWAVTLGDRDFERGYRLYYVSMEELDAELKENP